MGHAAPSPSAESSREAFRGIRKKNFGLDGRGTDRPTVGAEERMGSKAVGCHSSFVSSSPSIPPLSNGPTDHPTGVRGPLLSSVVP